MERDERFISVSIVTVFSLIVNFKPWFGQGTMTLKRLRVTRLWVTRLIDRVLMVNLPLMTIMNQQRQPIAYKLKLH